MAKYRKRIPFTAEQQALLMSNPYTAKVSAHRIVFTLEFKEFAMHEVKNPENTYKKIFTKAGYDVELLGHERMKSIMRSIKLEAASDSGLQEPKSGTRQQMLDRMNKDESIKKHTKTEIRELKERVNYLEQQIEFLKKISFLNKTKK